MNRNRDAASIQKVPKEISEEASHKALDEQWLHNVTQRKRSPDEVDALVRAHLTAILRFAFVFFSLFRF